MSFIVNKIAVDKHNRSAVLGTYTASVSDIGVETMIRVSYSRRKSGSNIILKCAICESYHRLSCTVHTGSVSGHLIGNQGLQIPAVYRTANSTHPAFSTIASDFTVYKSNITSNITERASSISGVPSIVTEVGCQVGFIKNNPVVKCKVPCPDFPQVTKYVLAQRTEGVIMNRLRPAPVSSVVGRAAIGITAVTAIAAAGYVVLNCAVYKFGTAVRGAVYGATVCPAGPAASACI